MSYEESFLSTCDAEGLAPVWAIQQIFIEHSVDFEEFRQAHPTTWDDGEAILNWIGY